MRKRVELRKTLRILLVHTSKSHSFGHHRWEIFQRMNQEIHTLFTERYFQILCEQTFLSNLYSGGKLLISRFFCILRSQVKLEMG